MWRDYEDLTSRLGDPLWYDDNGVPRYEPFHPNMMGVYDEVIALLEIKCQNCERVFQVAMSWDKMSIVDRTENKNDPRPRRDGSGIFHYGDPPQHGKEEGWGCTGNTMNSIPVRVLQFWIRNWAPLKKFQGPAWKRLPKEEVVWDD